MSYPPVLPVITAADGSFDFSNPDELISFDDYNTIFPENTHRSINKNKPKLNVGGDGTKLNLFESLQKNWIDSYNINNSANRQSEQDKVVGKIIRMGTLNPDTGSQFRDSNEVISYLDRIANR